MMIIIIIIIIIIMKIFGYIFPKNKFSKPFFCWNDYHLKGQVVGDGDRSAAETDDFLGTVAWKSLFRWNKETTPSCSCSTRDLVVTQIDDQHFTKLLL